MKALLKKTVVNVVHYFILIHNYSMKGHRLLNLKTNAKVLYLSENVL